MALAQLKLQQLKIRQTFEEKEQELKRSKQLTEAEMEITRAAVSLEIYQGAEEEKNCESKVNREQLLQTGLLSRQEIAAGPNPVRLQTLTGMQLTPQRVPTTPLRVPTTLQRVPADP